MCPKVLYDRKNCEAFWVCVAAAPDDFDENKEANTADLIKGREIAPGLWEKEIDEAGVDEAIAAANGCPSDVIRVVDDDGNLLAGPEKLPVEEEAATP